MINRNFLFSLAATAISVVSYGQSNILNAKVPSEIGKKTAAQDSLDNDKPLPYGYVDDRDRLFSKKVWETIDLSQRINFPFYFPVEDRDLGPDRKSLFLTLVDAVKSGKLTEIYGDSYFVSKKTFAEVESSFSFSEMNADGISVYNKFSNLKKYNGKDRSFIEADLLKTGKLSKDKHYDSANITPADVLSYNIVGLWYFDKRQGELKYRILGIAPVAIDALSKKRAQDAGPGDTGATISETELFWVFYPAARDILHQAKAFNEKNSSVPLTFDHLLNSRRFSSVITKQANVYGDRSISDYLAGKSQMQLLEAERVKETIRNFEQDMWNY